VSSWINLTAIWQIVVAGLLAGAGLPALVATGLYALSLPGKGQVAAGGSGQVAAGGSGQVGAGASGSGRVAGGSPAGMAAAVLCFATVLAAIGYGIYLIVSSSH
jgi:hypothetical protein